MEVEDQLFLGKIYKDIDWMRRLGLSDQNIAQLVTSIRSAAISSEFFRYQQMLGANSPTHHVAGKMFDLIKEFGG